MQITYDDKVSLTTSPLPRANKATAEDFNEIKRVVNANASATIITTANTDLNDYTETGLYFFGTNYTPINIPTSLVNGWLSVIKSIPNSFVKQIFYRGGTADKNDYETYIRTRVGGKWGNWQRLMVENDLYYKAGDTFSVRWKSGGFLTAASTEIQFSIPLPKRIPSGVTPTITSGKIWVRLPSGGYLLNNEDITLDNTIVLGAYSNILDVILRHSSAYQTTNNIPLAIQVVDLKIDFT